MTATATRLTTSPGLSRAISCPSGTSTLGLRNNTTWRIRVRLSNFLDIINKEFGHSASSPDRKSGKVSTQIQTGNSLITIGNNTWGNRQSEWYNAERRFIFACKTNGERMKWMTGIRLAVEAQKERIEDGNEIFHQLNRAKQAQDFGMGMS